jgi:hypothetical protein
VTGRNLASLLVVAAAIGGCGGGSNNDSERQARTRITPLAERVSAWRGAAISYNALLQRCEPNPDERGVVAVCTRRVRRDYESAATRLREALRAERPASRTCAHAAARARRLEAEVTKALTLTFKAHSALERAVGLHRPYRGPPFPEMLGVADKITEHATRIAPGVAATISQDCP